MPLEECLRLIKIYSKVQSSNYGKSITSVMNPALKESLRIYPNPVKKNGATPQMRQQWVEETVVRNNLHETENSNENFCFSVSWAGITY